MTKPARQRPDSNSDVGRRLQPNVEGLMPPPQRPEQAADPKQPTAASEAKEAFSTRLPAATLAAARAAVLATAGQVGGCRSLADLVTQAVQDKVATLENEFNAGQPFPKSANFRVGRPLGN